VIALRIASFCTVVVTLAWVAAAQAESVEVRYRGSVDLKPFDCTDVTRSSFIERVCYDKANEYMIVRLKGKYYHYCELPQSILHAFISADSMGRYYNSNIRGSGSDGPFDCRTRRIPSY
jgi:hypothetical protein